MFQTFHQNPMVRKARVAPRGRQTQGQLSVFPPKHSLRAYHWSGEGHVDIIDHSTGFPFQASGVETATLGKQQVSRGGWLGDKWVWLNEH